MTTESASRRDFLRLTASVGLAAGAVNAAAAQPPAAPPPAGAARPVSCAQDQIWETDPRP